LNGSTEHNKHYRTLLILDDFNLLHPYSQFFRNSDFPFAPFLNRNIEMLLKKKRRFRKDNPKRLYLKLKESRKTILLFF